MAFPPNGEIPEAMAATPGNSGKHGRRQRRATRCCNVQRGAIAELRPVARTPLGTTSRYDALAYAYEINIL